MTRVISTRRKSSLNKQMLEGRIIKGIAGFYYVHTGDVVYECKAKGIFRKDAMKPLVGDRVQIEVLDQPKCLGNLTRIHPRSSQMLRPQVANVDQAIVYFALSQPKPNWEMLDKLLVRIAYERIPIILVFNKTDLLSVAEQQRVRVEYEKIGYPIYLISATEGDSIEALRSALLQKTSVLAGPSGAGKSTFTNILQPQVEMQTQQISEKISRGKHTTRHAQLIPFEKDSFLVDTPGFTSIELPNELTAAELAAYYPEFGPFLDGCRFRSCLHRNEPDCAVKQAVEEAALPQGRWERYVHLLKELEQRKRY